MTNTQTPQWTVITAIGAKVWAADGLLTLSMETFIGMHSSRRKTGERSQTLGYFVEIKQWCFCLLSIPMPNTGLTIRAVNWWLSRLRPIK